MMCDDKENSELKANDFLYLNIKENQSLELFSLDLIGNGKGVL